MIESIMFFGLGFLGASLLWVLFIPLVHARAVRLTTRRMEASTPVSMAEIQADKDQLRAEFAMSTRRLEMSVDQLKTKTSNQLADLGKKTDAINRMKLELGEKTATIFALEAREKALRDQLRATEDELGVKTNTLRDAERGLADKEAELTRLTTDLNERTFSGDSQRVEIVSLRTQADALRERIAGLEREIKETTARFNREKTDAERATKDLAEERQTVGRLGNRVAELEKSLTAQTTEAEILSRRVADLETRLAEQVKQLAERIRERDQLKLDLDVARKIERDLREELGSVDRRHDASLESLRSEKALIGGQLERAREERARLQREIGGMKREAEATWASERVENALLRERINDVAAEVARLTAVLEGPGSTIETILNEPAAAKGGKPVPDAGPGSLAERIRALQNRASRLSAATGA